MRLLAPLESELGVRLLNRATRRMALTDEGREYYERCRLVLSAVNETEASLRARRAEPRGRLRVTSSATFGRSLLASLVVEFMAAHPQPWVELVLLDRVIDLVEEEIDVEVRLAQLPDSSLVALPVRADRTLTQHGMAVTADVGDADDIHPRNKQAVAERLARLALHRVHGHAISDSGPALLRWRRKGRSIVLEFAVGDGGPLSMRGGDELTGFTLAGADRRFAPAKARIKDREVHVWMDGIADPAAVRYGWADDPGHANLINQSGLPASPIRTDRWPLLSEGVRFLRPEPRPTGGNR